MENMCGVLVMCDGLLMVFCIGGCGCVLVGYFVFCWCI